VGSEFDRVQGFGFDAALTKPVTRAELTAAIVATLAARD
jgi:DNA-binding response OmpR family regulator